MLRPLLIETTTSRRLKPNSGTLAFYGGFRLLVRSALKFFIATVGGGDLRGVCPTCRARPTCATCHTCPSGASGQVGQGFDLGPSSGLFGASGAGVEGATLRGEKWGKWGRRPLTLKPPKHQHSEFLNFP